MSLDAYPQRSARPEVAAHVVRLEGVSTDISKLEGQGITASRTAAGTYRLTWAENPGQFLGWNASLGAAAPADLAGHTVVRDEWDATNLRLDFVVFNNPDTGTGGEPVAHDLAADEYVDIIVYFARTAL